MDRHDDYWKLTALQLVYGQGVCADNISMTLVKELFLNENAEITVASVEEASAVRREVQAYVDAISTSQPAQPEE